MTGFTRASAQQLNNGHYDLVVIGGGINGAAITRDAADRGLRVALLEKADFAVGTSSWNSRLIHGGLRYLEHGELPLVYESLHDRECLLRIAPHLVQPLPFVVPLYGHNHLPGWMFKIGLMLYDALSLRKSVPHHRSISRNGVAAELPGLNKKALSGALHYYDGQVDFPERLVLETVVSAHRLGAATANYMRVTGINTAEGRAVGVSARDEITGEEFTVDADCVVNAAGPWVDDLTGPLNIDRQIGGTTGTHLVVDPFPGAPDAAIYFEAKTDNRPILVIPWNGRYLIGTTDDRFTGDPETVRGTDDEVQYLLTETNMLIPEANLTVGQILYTYTGVRPLPYRPDSKPGAIPRSHLIVAHDNVPNLLSVVGGKLTPHLSLGSETVEKAGRILERKLRPSRTAATPLPGATASQWSGHREASQQLRELLPWDAPINKRLVAVYGARARQILARWEAEPQLQQVIGTGRGAVLAAEIAFVLEDEGALTLVDILHRRTMVGLEPDLATGIAQEVALVAGKLQGWSPEEIEHQVAGHREYITRLLGGVKRSQFV